MKYLESKGVKVEAIGPLVQTISRIEVCPGSYHLHIGEDEKYITVDTSDDALCTQAKEIDPNDTEKVFLYLKTLRNRINWLI